MKKIILCSGFALFTILGTFAQNKNVGIGTLTPDSSAILELKAANKGILIPRTDTSAIVNPATGLLIYQIPDSTFYFFDGIIWRPLGNVSIGPTGLQGPQGFAGNAGPQGATGADGIQGITGADGIQGVTGADGPQGLQGIQGPTGIDGNQGPTGPTGAQGAQGIDGQTGANGTTGAQGMQGIQGPTGATGAQGAQGIDGITGADGIPGVTGADGTPGVTGIDGVTGPQGLQGIQGPTGADGLMGPQGLQGIPGVTGVDGTTGQQGIQGNQGPTGSDGPPGQTGTAGAQGLTGADGPMGPQGAQGIQGVAGSDGIQGVTGANGSVGPQGLQGVAGPTGTDGALNAWSLTGNSGTTPGTNFIGTNDLQDWVIKTNSTEKVRVTSAGDLGVGTSIPGAKLDAAGTIRSVLNSNEGGNISIFNSSKSGAITNDWRIWNMTGGYGNGLSFWRYYADGTNAGPSAWFGDNGNVGFGTTAPAYRLDLNGGSFAFGSGNVRTETRNDAGLQGNSGAQSGFFETASPTNYPAGASSWWHLIDVRHSNNGNNYALQIAGSFFDQDLYYRKTNSSPTTPWSKILTSGNGGVTTACGSTNYVTKMTNSSTIGCSQIYDDGNGVGVATTSPAYKFHVAGDIYANGGWFRVSGSNGLYWESFGPGWYVQDGTWLRTFNNASIWANTGTIATNGSFSGGYGGASGPGGGAIFAGSVGIGVSSPSEKLHVLGKTTLSRDGLGECCSGGNFTMALSENTGANGNMPTLQFHSGGYHEGYLRLLGNQGGARRFQMGDYQGAGMGLQMSGPVYVDGTGNSYVMGSLGVGTNNPSYKLHVIGTIRSNGVDEISDMRYKRDINTIDNALSQVSRLRGVYFNWRMDEFVDQNFDSSNQIGFIAQEVEKVLPHVVKTDKNGFKSVEYSKVTAVLVEAIKEQQKIIEIQQSAISKLKTEIGNMKTENNNNGIRIKKLEEILKSEAKK